MCDIQAAIQVAGLVQGYREKKAQNKAIRRDQETSRRGFDRGYLHDMNKIDQEKVNADKEKTKAELKDDKYIVNGTKTWTTLAQHADWIFCLVRTETTPIKQEGISFLLIDMKTPGIEVKPIITIDGSHEVNMVYFDNVEVPSENLVG